MAYDPASFETRCEHCRAMFPMPKSAAGSLQNCPECGRSTQIEGVHDPLWAGLQFAAVAGLVASSVVAYQFGGPAAAGTVLLVGTVVLGALRSAL